MTGDKLMREAFLEQTVAIATVPRELKWFIWQIAIRACAAECARIALSVWDNGEEGAHGGEQANRTAKAIRERFGVE